jgi:singapore isolate B (sub-type 7) whole genome shotgun sequence assembly, scaffold_1
MLEVVYNVKNNRDSAEMKQEKEKTSMIRNLVSKTFGASATPLSIGLADIRNIPTNGRWWVLGAQYKPTKRDATQEKKTSLSRIIAEADPKVLKAAEKLHMNTSIRKCDFFCGVTNRAIFIVIITGSDYMETFDKLLQLNLQSVQEREIIRIILVCAARVGEWRGSKCRKSSTIRIIATC